MGRAMHFKRSRCGIASFIAAVLLVAFSMLARAQITTSVSSTFTVQATLQAGCVLGGGSTNVSSFGTINFGQVTLLPSNVDVNSSVSAGSIVLRCTPGVAATVTLGPGQNVTGSILGGRLLKNTLTTETLGYQLYIDNARTTIWGGGSSGGTAQSITATGVNQTLVVYARLFAKTTMPSAGTYNDTVLVTLTF